MSFHNRKVAFVFPGQGAQYVGMGSDLLTADDESRSALEAFDRDHGVNLAQIMSEGPEESLKETRFTQPAILLHSICAFRALQKALPFAPDFVAGHSLGEFTALTASGVLNLSNAMHLVHRRGEFMIAANQGQPFAMAALLGLSPQQVREICTRASEAGVVVAANFNTPIQTVISGSEAGVARAGELAKEAGAKRVVPLVVGGPFHSPLIERASEWLAAEIANVSFKPSTIPVVSNVDARPTVDIETIKSNLIRQVTSSVLWVDTMQFLLDEGVKLFVEFGPQKVLSGMIKAVDKEVPVFNVDRLEDVSAVCSALENLV
jgi:[acyl-carrier-protein] S-malonyltransferase